MGKNKAISLAQIFILVVGIIAVGYMISDEVKIVSANDTSNSQPTPSSSSTSKTNPIPATLTSIGSAGLVTVGTKYAKDLIKPVAKGTGEVVRSGTGVESLFGSGSEGFFTTTAGKAVVHILISAGVALAVGVLTRYVGEMAGLSVQHAQALGWSLGSGTFAGMASYGSSGIINLLGFTGTGLTAGLISTGIGAGVALIVIAITWKNERQQIITFENHAWQPATGGKDCAKCNNELLGCSEYQCKSLGQSCSLINEGTTEQKCAWNNSKDIQPPTIEPFEDVLKNGYEYTPDNAISPPNRGVKIEYNKSSNKCAPAFSPISFGIELSEEAKCKADTVHTAKFDDMTYWFGGSQLNRLKHNMTISVPSKDALAQEGITLDNGGKFEVYVRCQDPNGNENTGEFVFEYCVDQGPDVTAPEIAGTNLVEDTPIAFGQTELSGVKLFISEPVEGCKWSFSDQTYTDMPATMDCSNANSVSQMDSNMFYSCKTTLNGLKDRQDNYYYFRCKDKSGNTNEQSFKLNLVGTQTLSIDKITPNDTIIKDSSDTVKVNISVETSAGYKDGESMCYFSEEDVDTSYILFTNTESYKHSQELYLETGEYNLWIKCIDLGGNYDKEQISFTIDTDRTEPEVVRIYQESGYLKFITSEDATCVYDTIDCNYAIEDGTKISTTQGEYGTNHYTSWDTKKEYFVKCQDKFGNQPASNTCSIIARPFENIDEE